MTKDKYILLYITVGSKDEALNIGKTLLDEKLVACINIVDGMDSIYRWNGVIQESQEAILLAKTRKDFFNRVKHRVQQLHSYDVPCIVSFDINNVESKYKTWLGENILNSEEGN